MSVYGEPIRRRRSVRAAGDASEEAGIGDLSGLGDRSETLTDQAYLRLEEMITTLQLRPGSFLSEFALADRLGIGRTPIREALQRLSRDGLVVVIPRRGVLVSEINLKTQLRLLEARRVVEALLARLATERADDEQRRAFHNIAADMRAAADHADDIAFMRLDREFNGLLADASGNEFAARCIATMSSLSRRFWYRHYKEADDLAVSARMHAEVAEAIAFRNADAAVAASERLMAYIERFARKTLDM